MRKMQTGLIIAIIASVFFVSFLVGRAAVLKKSAEEDKKEMYNGFAPIPGHHEKEEEIKEETEKVVNKTEKVKDYRSETVSPPEKLLFPCGTQVSKEYSQIAVYSETMDDWRAHTGTDYAADLGSEVVAAWDGQVTEVYKDKLWGHTIVIKHQGELESVYKNLSPEIFVEKGQLVEGGQAIGLVGKSADIESLESPHLHFELFYKGTVINPISYVY